MKKSQAALEFLSTYAWAFIIVLITLGALYYSGIFDINKFLPQKCIFPLQFKCLDFALLRNEVRIKLVNNLGEDIRVNAISLSNDASPSVRCVNPLIPFVWTASDDMDIAFTGCLGGGYIPGERVELKISFDYHAINTPSQPSHSVSGKIHGKVSN